MATRVATIGGLTGIEEMERKLVELVEQVELEKEKTRNTFQQLHSLLMIREEGLLSELDGVVVLVRQELIEKREVLHELQAAKKATERELTKNTLQMVLRKNLQTIEDEIREVLSRPLNVTWVELQWKREQLEQSIVEVSNVVKMKKGPSTTEDYSLKLRPVWHHEGTGSSVIEEPHQLAIHAISGNIFVADWETDKIQVFDKAGLYLYHIRTPPKPIGLCLSDENIFLTSNERKLLKIRISKKKITKSVVTEESVYGMDISNDIYVCEYSNKSVSVFDKSLNFLKRIPLKSPHFRSDTEAYCIRLYGNNMYVMFYGTDYCLQVFSQDGQLIRGVISSSYIKGSFFFALDQIGNIIVADYRRYQIKILSNSGHLIHTISNDNLTEEQKLYHPRGISVDKENNIIVAHKNKKCNLVAF